jgi:hypothetical protein
MWIQSYGYHSTYGAPASGIYIYTNIAFKKLCSQSELANLLYGKEYIFIVLEREKGIKMTHIYMGELFVLSLPKDLKEPRLDYFFAIKGKVPKT